MRTVVAALLLGAFLITSILFAETQNDGIAEDAEEGRKTKALTPLVRIDGSMLSVDLEIVINDEDCEILLRLTSKCDREMSLVHPNNMGATAFLLMDDKGNLIAPVRFDEFADILYVERPNIVLKPGGKFRLVVSKSHERRGHLNYASGNRHFSHTLQFGKTYRIIAVYRPSGIHGEGVCSAEKVVKYGPNPLEM